MKSFLSRAGRVSVSCILSAALALPATVPALADDTASQEDIESMEANIESLRQEEQEARDAAEAAEQEAQRAQEEKSVLEAQVQEAQARLSELSLQAEAAQSQLITITAQLAETEERIVQLDEQIRQTQQELAESKDELAEIVNDSYKNGRPTLLSVALNSTSFDDFVSRVQYANKVAEYETSVVVRVKDLEASLQQQKAESEEQRALQQQQKAEQEQRVAELDAAVDALESYQAQLSAEIQQKIAEADEAIRLAAAESARADAAQAQRLAEEEAKRQAEEAARRAAEEARRRAEEEAEAQRRAAEAARQRSSASSTVLVGGGDFSGSSATYATGDVQTLVSRAFNIIGSGYSWHGYYWTGSPSSSWFTCSGVVDYALGLPSQSNSPATLKAQVGSRLTYDNSQLQYGDLVFYDCLGLWPGHVAIYIGGGMVIDSIPNGGVGIRAVDYMPTSGGGPIL